jgi:hypothetical protein
MNDPYYHQHQHHDKEEKEEDGMILSTAQLDCRLLQGELIVAHVKRECKWKWAGGGASGFESGVSSVGSFHSHARHAHIRTYIHITGEHVLQASWIILKVALYAEEEEDQEEEHEEEEEESAAVRRRQESDHYQQQHHNRRRRQQQQVQ